MVKEIKNSFKLKPDVIVLDRVFDIKSWTANYIPSIHDHLKAHQFKFQNDPKGVVKMFYKEWSTDDFWLPQSGMYFFLNFNGSTTPCGTPNLVNAQFDLEKTQKVENTLSKLTGYLEKSDALDWWKSFIAKMKQTNTVHEDPECKLLWWV